MNSSFDRQNINKLAFDEACRSIDHQKSIFSSIRQRAVTLATFSVAISAFLGRAALSEDDQDGIWSLANFSIWEFAALILQILILIRCTALMRSKALKLTLSPGSIIKQFSYGEKSTTLEDTYAHLVVFLEKNCRENQLLLDTMQIRINHTLPLLLPLIIFWFADLA